MKSLNRVKPRLLSILTLSLFFLTCLNYTPVHAFTNAAVQLGNTNCWITCAGTLTITASYNTIGDLLTVESGCGTNNAISTVSATGTGTDNGWTKATSASLNTGTTTVWIQNSAVTTTFGAEIWYASVKTTGSTTVSITYTSSNTACYVELDESNIPFNAFNNAMNINGVTTNAASSSFNLQGTISPNNPLNNNNYLVISLGMYFTTPNRPAAGNGCANAINCLSTIPGNSQLNQGLTPNSNNGEPTGSLTTGFVYSTTPNPVTMGVNLNANSNTAGLAPVLFIAALFSTTGQNPVCGTGSTTSGQVGGITVASGTTKLISNKTYYYPFVLSTSQTAVFDSFIFNISSIALTNTQTKATLTITLYAGRSVTPSNSNPLVEYTPYVYTFTVVNGGTQVIVIPTFNPSINAPLTTGTPNTNNVFAIAVGASHDGINVVNASSSTPYYTSSVPFSGGMPPASITSATLSTKVPINFLGNYHITCAVNVTTTSTSTVTQTNGQTTTVNCGAAASDTCGGFTVLGLLNYWPIWVLPLVMGGLFGIIGVLLGFIMGTAIGVMIGIIPTWLVFLLGLAMFAMIVRREF